MHFLFHELLILSPIYPCVHSHTCTLDQEKGHLENRPGHKYLSTQLPEIDRPGHKYLSTQLPEIDRPSHKYLSTQLPEIDRPSHK